MTKLLAVTGTASILAFGGKSSSHLTPIVDHAKPKDCSHFFGLRPDPICPAGVLNSPEVPCHASSVPPPFRAPSCSPPPTRSPHSHPRHWMRTSSRRLGTGKPPPTPNRRRSSAQAT